MTFPPIAQRRRALRWLAPVGVVCIAGLAATGVLKSGAASQSLPHTTPTALLAAVQTSDVPGFSGTVVSQLSLGLPELPSLGGSDQSSSMASLLSGSHTLQVWYGGRDQQRVALFGTTDETDVFRNGRDMWQWSSSDHTAVHTTVPVRSETRVGSPVATAPSSLTPEVLARRALQALNASTHVTVEGHRTVADRSAYDLVLTPRSTATKIGSVHIAIDGATKMPLGVQIYARRSTSPAVDVAFSAIKFARQPNRNFVFSPPPGATVHDVAGAGADRPRIATATAGPRITGSGWTSVVAATPGRTAINRLLGRLPAKDVTPVSGAWGSGRLLQTELVSVLVTDDGRLFAGAVEPSSLYAVAAK